MLIASPVGVFDQRPTNTGKIADDSWACSKSVYGAEPTVCYLGLWLRARCYHVEKVSPISEPSVNDSVE